MNKMTKEEIRELILTTIVCLIPVVAGIVLYPVLPEQIATHWDAQGNVNGMSSKLAGAIIMPASLLVLNLLFPLLLRMDPKYENMDGKLKAITHWTIPVIEMICSGATLASALGRNVRVEMIIPMVLGVIFVLIGNYLPKTKQSYTMGIKLPWTLASEENWNRTHRLGGFVWVIGGILIIIFSFLPWKLVPFFVIVFLMTIIPCVYSYLFYLKEKKQNQSEDEG